MICFVVPRWSSWLWDQIAFSNPESDVVWRIWRLPPWPQPWILEPNDLAILNLHVTPMPTPPPTPSIKFRLNLTYGFGGDVAWSISRYQMAIWNRPILAILNFNKTPVPLIKFKLSQSYRSWADVIWRFSRWLPRWPSWISKRNNFSNSKSPSCPDAFHKVSAPSEVRFGSRYS